MYNDKKRKNQAEGFLLLDDIASNFYDQWPIYRSMVEIKTMRGDIGDIQDIAGK